MVRFRYRLFLAVGLAVVASRGFAEDLPGDPIIGRQIAEQWCGECHAVEPAAREVDLIPSFQEVADDPAATAIALRVFLQTPHETMPNAMPAAEETDHIIAYVLSLKGR